jgi:hypothetical protein
MSVRKRNVRPEITRIRKKKKTLKNFPVCALGVLLCEERRGPSHLVTQSNADTVVDGLNRTEKDLDTYHV